MSPEQSPFERPSVSEGYPLDKQEERLLNEALARLREKDAVATVDRSVPVPTTEDGVESG
jgi:hypothetical protein